MFVLVRGMTYDHRWAEVPLNVCAAVNEAVQNKQTGLFPRTLVDRSLPA